MESLNCFVCTSHPTKLLGVFAKYWRAGLTKTRLAAAIGDSCAAQVSQLLTETTLRRFADAADGFLVGFTPRVAESAFRQLASNRWGLWPQPDGDLGERMKVFFQLAAKDFPYTVLIGCDSPDMPLEFVVQAFAELVAHDVVIGPATDGGYYLLGIAGQPPPIFHDIDWGSRSVYQQTINRLMASRRRFFVLPEWPDVDDDDALTALLGRLFDSRRHDPALAQLADCLKGVLSGGTAV